MIIERIYSEHGAQDPGIYENRSVYPSPDYHGRTGLANEDDRLLRRNSSPASSTSSISNPALLAIERPTSPTRETPTGWEVVKALLRTVYATAWLCSGAALLGLVGHSVGWVVLHNAFATSDADASTRTDVACAVRPGVFGAVVLSVPSVIAYLAVLRRGQPQTRAQGVLFPPDAGSGEARTNRSVARRTARYTAFGLVLVLYGALSGALGSVIVTSGCTISVRFAASVGAAGWSLLALTYAMCDSILCEMGALEVARIGSEENLRL